MTGGLRCSVICGLSLSHSKGCTPAPRVFLRAAAALQWPQSWCGSHRVSEHPMGVCDLGSVGAGEWILSSEGTCGIYSGAVT